MNCCITSFLGHSSRNRCAASLAPLKHLFSTSRLPVTVFIITGCGCFDGRENSSRIVCSIHDFAYRRCEPLDLFITSGPWWTAGFCLWTKLLNTQVYLSLAKIFVTKIVPTAFHIFFCIWLFSWVLTACLIFLVVHQRFACSLRSLNWYII